MRLLVTSLTLFRTKKKSSKGLWSFWMLLLSFVTAVAVTFTISEIMQMTNQKIVYTTFKTPTIADRWHVRPEHGITVSDRSLTVYFGPEEVIIGTAEALTAPNPNGQLVFLPRGAWKDTLAKAVLASPSVRELFPTNSLGIALSGSEATAAGYTEVMFLSGKVRELNERLGGDNEDPVATYFLDVRSGFLGVN